METDCLSSGNLDWTQICAILTLRLPAVDSLDAAECEFPFQAVEILRRCSAVKVIWREVCFISSHRSDGYRLFPAHGSSRDPLQAERTSCVSCVDWIL